MTFYERPIDHVNLSVPNLEEAVEFYTKTLGFKNIGEYQKGEMKFVFVSNGTISYEIMQKPEFGVGTLEHMAYSSPDLQKDYDYFMNLDKDMVLTEIGFVQELFEKGMYYFFIKSPTGERVEFCQRKV